MGIFRRNKGSKCAAQPMEPKAESRKRRYKIWNKTDPVYTPIGEMFTPEQWMQKHKSISMPGAIPIVSADLVNGAFCGELHCMLEAAEYQGACFTEGASPEQLLEEYEIWEENYDGDECITMKKDVLLSLLKHAAEIDFEKI